MSSLILLAAAAATLPTTGAVPTGVLTPPTAAAIAGIVPLANRARGVHVVDAAGAAVGTIDQSTADMVVVLVGSHKLQLPANALRSVAGIVTLPVTADQIEQVLATSAAFQARTNPPPKPVIPVHLISLPSFPTPSTKVALP